MTERGYIPENKQIQTQPEPEQKRPQERKSTGLKRIKQVGAVMAVLLAADLGFIAAAKTTNNNEPEVDRQTVTDALNHTGYYDTQANPPTNPATPDNWGMVIRNPSNPPVYDFNNNIAHSAPGSVRVTTDGTTTCESNGWITLQDFPIDPSKTYNLNFVAGYDSSGNKVLPEVIVDWKDNTGQSLNSTDTATLTSNGNPNPVDNWYPFNRTYGLGQNASIPPAAAKGSLEIEGNPTGACSGILHVDDLSLTTTTASPTPTLPPSVGGIAEMPNLPPTATLSHSSKDTLVTNVEIAIGSAAALAAAAVTGAEINKRRKPKSQSK